MKENINAVVLAGREVELTTARASATMCITDRGEGLPHPRGFERERIAVGLLDVFRKKEPVKAQPAVIEEPEVYAGMRVEVSAMNGNILFGGKMMNRQGERATVYQYAQFGPIPDESVFRVQIRGYNERTRKAVHMEGTVTAQPQHVWAVEELKVIRSGNERAFFRLETDLDATISVLGRGFGIGEHPCKMLNISIGGVCVRTDLRQYEGDKLLLKVQLMEERDVSLMFCQIVRVIENGDGTFSYGCRFLELNREDEERISYNIFSAQQKKRNV